jgi:fused signal recognition particle receptor
MNLMLGWFRKKKKEAQSSGPAGGDTVLQQTDHEEADKGGDRSAGSSVPATAETKHSSPGPSSSAIATQAAEVAPGTIENAAPSIFKKLSERLYRTRESFTQRIDELFLGKKKIDAALFDELEEILVTADLGITTTMELLETARKQVKRDSLSDPQQLKAIIKDSLKTYLSASSRPAELVMPQQGPFVIMVVGVNGVGKTTTIGKIAAKFNAAGRSVLLVAADTFRAAAISQLKIWGERNGARVIAHQEGADPSSVVFDAMAMAVSKGYDVVLIDTAGRLHTRANLMEELKKIKRVIGKQLAGAPHEVLLVIDATTGQNGISQATLFNEAIGVTGVALTKLDGTAKGGIVATITRELRLPIRFIGVGEQLDDLRDFDADEFIEALFAENNDTNRSSGQHTTRPS